MNVESRRLVVLTIVSLAVAAAALGVAGWTLYRSDYAKAEYSSNQIADAKTKACTAVDVVRRGVSLNTNLMPAGGPAISPAPRPSQPTPGYRSSMAGSI